MENRGTSLERSSRLLLLRDGVKMKSVANQFDATAVALVSGVLIKRFDDPSLNAASRRVRSILVAGTDSFAATSMLRLAVERANAALRAPCNVETVSLAALMQRCTVGGGATSVVNAFEEAVVRVRAGAAGVLLLAGLDRLLWHCGDAMALASAPPEQLRLRQRVLLLLRGGGGGGGVQDASDDLVVFATVSVDDALDDAVRGAFDLELALSVPTPAQRAATFRACLDCAASSSSPALPPVAAALRTAEGCAALADLCRAYTFADVVCALNSASAGAVARGGSLDAAAVHHAVAAHSPLLLGSSDAVEWIVDAPNVPWSAVGGMRDVKRALEEMVVWPQAHPEAFARLGVVAPRSILLHGAPGTGKTLLAKAVATRSKARFLAVSVPSIVKSEVGGGVRALKRFFAIAEQSAPCIIFFDEIEALFGSRDTSSAHERRLMAQMLVSIDRLAAQSEAHRRVVLIAATNCPWQLDLALLQRGRLSRVVYVPPPDAEGRREILELQRARMRWAADVCVEDLTRRTARFTGAEVVNLCQTAALDALRESGAGAGGAGGVGEAGEAPPAVARAHFDAALRQHLSAHKPVNFARFAAWRPPRR